MSVHLVHGIRVVLKGGTRKQKDGFIAELRKVNPKSNEFVSPYDLARVWAHPKWSTVTFSYTEEPHLDPSTNSWREGWYQEGGN